MDRKRFAPRTAWAGITLLLLSAIALASGCQAQTITPKEMHAIETVVVQREDVEEVKIARDASAPLPTPVPGQSSAKEGGSGLGTAPLASPYRASRKIIKNAELALLMEDVSSGVDRVTQVAADSYGYILSSRTWYQNDYQYATITIGVPVDEFENALRRLRGMAIQVQDENASGTDVSDQFVDLESRLRNLEATEARIRSFLEQATNIEESLRINAQLTEITAQIEEVKGQMNYIADRAAYSTITVHLKPQIVAPMPTPAPEPEPDVWRPDRTLRRAAAVLGSMLRVVGDMTIWTVVVLGPFLVPIALILGAAIRISRRRARQS